MINLYPRDYADKNLLKGFKGHHSNISDFGIRYKVKICSLAFRGRDVYLCDGDVHTHSSGHCQLVHGQHDELWVYVIQRQYVRCMLTIAESCSQAFEVIDIYGDSGL